MCPKASDYGDSVHMWMKEFGTSVNEMSCKFTRSGIVMLSLVGILVLGSFRIYRGRYCTYIFVSKMVLPH